MKTLTLNQHHESIGFKLWIAAHLWQTKLKKMLAKLELSPLELILISTLYDLITEQGEATQEQIAKKARVGKMTVSKTLRALEKKHFLHRKEHAIDTRAKSVTINNNGMYVLKKALQTVENCDKEFFQETQSHLTVLTKMLKTLSN